MNLLTPLFHKELTKRFHNEFYILTIILLLATTSFILKLFHLFRVCGEIMMKHFLINIRQAI